MPTVIASIEQQLQSLTKIAAINEATSIKLLRLLHLLCRESLDREPAERYTGLSHINANGLPLQWSFVLAPGPPTIRFVCECGMLGTDVHSRYRLSLDRIEGACSIIGIPLPTWLEPAILQTALPDSSCIPGHWESALWFAVSANTCGIGLKLYINIDRGTPLERWLSFGHILKRLERYAALERLCGLSARVSKDSLPRGICVDLCDDGFTGRVKLYFENDEVSLEWLRTWYAQLEANTYGDILIEFLKDCGIDTVHYPRKSFFVSLEINALEQLTLKTDVPVCRWINSDKLVVASVVRLAKRLGLPTEDYLFSLDAIGATLPNADGLLAHQLVGLGYEADGSHHINVYCQPILKPAL